MRLRPRFIFYFCGLWKTIFWPFASTVLIAILKPGKQIFPILSFKKIKYSSCFLSLCSAPALPQAAASGIPFCIHAWLPMLPDAAPVYCCQVKSQRPGLGWSRKKEFDCFARQGEPQRASALKVVWATRERVLRGLVLEELDVISSWTLFWLAGGEAW